MSTERPSRYPTVVFWTDVLAVGTWDLAGVSWWFDRQQIGAQRDAADRQIAAQQEAERVSASARATGLVQNDEQGRW